MPATANLLLRSLSSPLRHRLLAQAVEVSLPLRATLFVAEAAPRHAYFLLSGVASVVASGADGQSVEVELIGREGVVGGAQLLGDAVVPTRCFMQLQGTALRIRLADLRVVFLASEELRAHILAFVQQQLFTLSQIAACHRMHDAEQRLARWLLMVEDRIGESTLRLTQEFLAEMLGSQRTTVSAVASALQKNGVIEYTRGHLRIVDRDALERASCGCYGVTQRLLKGLYAETLPPPLALNEAEAPLVGAA